jgi:hypothetical protein
VAGQEIWSQVIVNSLMKAFVIAGAFVTSVASFAQSNDPATRAQVRAELVELEQTGWRPTQGHNTYPADMQAAEARVVEKNRASDVGRDAYGSSDSGHPLVSNSH